MPDCEYYTSMWWTDSQVMEDCTVPIQDAAFIMVQEFSSYIPTFNKLHHYYRTDLLCNIIKTHPSSIYTRSMHEMHKINAKW